MSRDEKGKQVTSSELAKQSLRFIILFGVISLLADFVYEGARSISGPFLNYLHANAFQVGFFAGLGELIGYTLRLLTGYLADRTKKYWFFVFLGYSLNLFSVPLLALAGHWQLAVGFMMMERLGKAIRTPSRDAMLAHATEHTGRGRGYGLHEAMDQIGATLGPLMVIAAFSLSAQPYQSAYSWFLVPAVLAILILGYARFKYPTPEKLSVKSLHLNPSGLNRFFWIYMVIISLIALGFSDFPLMAFHWSKTGLLTEKWIPGLYAIAMIADAASALVFGRLYDRFGLKILAFPLLVCLGYAPLAFYGDSGFAIITGAIVWGIGLGAQESIMKAVVASIAPKGKIASAFGIFHTVYGLSWFLGSTLMGAVYQHHLAWLIGFALTTQITAIVLIIRLSNKTRGEKA